MYYIFLLAQQWKILRNSLQTESGANFKFWNKVGKMEEVKIIGRFGLGTYNDGRENFGGNICSLANIFQQSKIQNQYLDITEHQN